MHYKNCKAMAWLNRQDDFRFFTNSKKDPSRWGTDGKPYPNNVAGGLGSFAPQSAKADATVKSGINRAEDVFATALMQLYVKMTGPDGQGQNQNTVWWDPLTKVVKRFSNNINPNPPAEPEEPFKKPYFMTHQVFFDLYGKIMVSALPNATRTQPLHASTP